MNVILLRATAALAVLAGAGCAAPLELIWPAPDRPYEIEVEESATALSITASPGEAGWRWLDAPGLAASGLLAANVSRLALRFSSENAANQYALAAAVLGMGMDVAVTWALRASREPADKPASVRLQGPNAFLNERTIDAAGQGSFRARIPDRPELKGALDITILSAGGRILATQTRGLAGEDRGPAAATQDGQRDAARLDRTRDAGTSDIDRPPAWRSREDPDAFGVVIGIEKYSRLPDVPYAGSDAAAVRAAFGQAFGVPEDHIVTLRDDRATRAGLAVALGSQLQRRVLAGRSHVYVYFAGHGAPDVASRAPYLVPYDGDPNYPAETCLPTSEVFRLLRTLGARSVTVVLDACFTGQTGRSGEGRMLLAGARPLAVAAVPSAPPPGVVVFSATGPAEVSSAWDARGHGLFTYFLVKGLQQQRRWTARDLHAYLAREVPRQAALLDREQHPTLQGQDVGLRLLGP